MTPCAILKLCHVVGQPVSLTTSGPCPGPLGAQSRPVLGSSHMGGHTTSLSCQFSQPVPEGPAALLPSRRRPWRGGCDVPSVHVSGCRPCHPDTCVSCLTRAMPVASPACGLCVGRGWGPGLAPSGWAAGAWSWNRSPGTGDHQVGGVDGIRGGGSHPRLSRCPAESVPAAPGGLRLGGRGPESCALLNVGHGGSQTKAQEGRLSWRRLAPQLLNPNPTPQDHVRASPSA